MTYRLKFYLLLVLFSSIAISQENKQSTSAHPAPNEGCLTCHQGIEPIKDHSSLMMQQIFAMGVGQGDANGCVVCHGGSPTETHEKKGRSFRCTGR